MYVESLHNYGSTSPMSAGNTSCTRRLVLLLKSYITYVALYSGKIWQGINFGVVVNLSKSCQYKNYEHSCNCACVFVLFRLATAIV